MIVKESTSERCVAIDVLLVDVDASFEQVDGRDHGSSLGCVVEGSLAPDIWHVDSNVFESAVRRNSFNGIDFIKIIWLSYLDKCIVKRCSSSDINFIHVDAFLYENSFQVKIGFSVGQTGIYSKMKKVSAFMILLLDICSFF